MSHGYMDHRTQRKQGSCPYTNFIQLRTPSEKCSAEQKIQVSSWHQNSFAAKHSSRIRDSKHEMTKEVLNEGYKEKLLPQKESQVAQRDCAVCTSGGDEDSTTQG